MNVRLWEMVTQTARSLPWAPVASLMGFAVLLGVWAIPGLAVPLNTAAAVLGSYATVRMTTRSMGERRSGLSTEVRLVPDQHPEQP